MIIEIERARLIKLHVILVLNAHTVYYLAGVHIAFYSYIKLLVCGDFIVCDDTDVCPETGAWMPIIFFGLGRKLIFC